MSYQKWKDSVMDALVRAGFERSEALVKANSIRGLYYSEENYPHPQAIANKIVESMSKLEQVWLKHNAKKRAASQLKGYAIISHQTA